jgi:hypothetical protein
MGLPGNGASPPEHVQLMIKLDLTTHEVQFQAPNGAPRWMLYGMLDIAREMIMKTALQQPTQASPILRVLGLPGIDRG